MPFCSRNAQVTFVEKLQLIKNNQFSKLLTLISN